MILVQYLIPLTRRQHLTILRIIDNLGVFCALDVFFIGLLLVKIEMGPITNTIIDQDSAFCKTLTLYGYDESCLAINFEVYSWMTTVFMCKTFNMFFHSFLVLAFLLTSVVALNGLNVS